MRILAAAGLVLIGVVTAPGAVANANQRTPAAALPEELKTHVKSDRFQIVTSVRGLPLGVRDELQVLFGSSTLDIAERGAEFGSSTLSMRRLVTAGCSIEYCLVYYERDGTPHTWHVALFHWTPAATRFEWGGTAPSGLKTIDDVRNAVQSGAIAAPGKVW